MPDLPSGTVTFLFTDIEGSTRLWDAHAEQMASALQRHDTLLREAIAAHAGVVFRTVGDAFCAAFSTPTDALNAVIAAQRALNAEVWPEAVSVRVRMALHTDAAEAHDGDYFGPPINRVARLLSLGHGGQTILSLSVQTLVQNSLPKGGSLRDLGTHRLKDLTRPEQVFQLLHSDLPSEFPPLKSLEALPNNLPLQLTSFIGREKEMEEVKALFPQTRLLTLTGSGGCGKTRLSVQVAADLLDQFPDGVWLVELAQLVDSSLVPQTVAALLNLREQPGKPYIQTLTEYLKSKTLLLLLDNCEHLRDACAQFSNALLHACTQVKILASSREALGIAGEQAYRVPSLSLPPLPSSHHAPNAPGDQSVTARNVNEYEAVRLFVDRALLTQPTFEVTDQNAFALASVCRCLDGIPLAIELAAARVRSLPIEEINKRLDQRFRLLTSGSRTALPRQQTLRALIDWSYDLLNDQEKTLLCRLSVFSGGWTLEAAEQVCGGEGVQVFRYSGIQEESEEWKREAEKGKRERENASYPTPEPLNTRIPEYLNTEDVLDLLTSLTDKSLVIAETQGETARYRLLETVRQYARDRLAESEEPMVVRARHRDYFLMLAEEIKPKITGPEQAHWLSVLEEEHDNLRTALTFCLEEPEGGEKGLRLAAALQLFRETRGHLSEARVSLTALLACPAAQERTKARADALSGVARLARIQGDYASSRTLFEESLEINRELGNRQGMASSLNGMGLVASDLGDSASARALHEESLKINRELGNSASVAVSLNNLGIVASDQGDYASARSLYEESLTIHRELGNRTAEASNLAGLGNVAYFLGDYATARSLYAESLEIRRELGNKWGIAASLNNLGAVAFHQGDNESARAAYEECLAINRELGNRHGVAISLSNLGNVSRDQGDYATARSLYEESLEIRRELEDKRGIAETFSSLGNVSRDQGDYATARSLYEESLGLQRELGDRRGIAASLHSLGSVAFGQEDYATARTLFKESLEIRRELGNKLGIANDLEAFASLAIKEKREEHCIRLWGAASTLRETIGAPLPPNEREAQEAELAEAREVLGEAAFAAAWEEGRAMTLEQAIEYALG